MTTPPGPPEPWQPPEEPASGQAPPPVPPPPPPPPPPPGEQGGYQALPPGYPAAGGYPAGYQGGYPTPPRSSGTAVAVMVLGIVGLVLTCAYGFGVVAAIVALALSPRAKREIAASGGTLTGEGMVKAGVICSWISVGLTVAGILFVVVLVIGGTAANAAPW